MKACLFILILWMLVPAAYAQTTFNSGWHNYKIGMLVRTYNYTFDYATDVKLQLSDSSLTFSSPDSLVIMNMDYPAIGKAIVKTVTYLSKNKQIIKKEEYSNNVLESISEWKYDNKNRNTSSSIHNERKNSYITKTYSYQTAKEGTVVMETSLYNGRPEFYTQDYYDKKNVRYKEVRLNDNKKDIVHIETYKYDSRGRVKERAVFFPEFGVTKHFIEGDHDNIKCFKQFPIISETILPKEALIKRNLIRLKGGLQSKDCDTMEYILYFNNRFCQLTINKEKTKKTVSLKITDHY